jgi:uncharacterized membrane protein
MATDQQRQAALGVLAELVPADVLGRAHELAQEIERDEYVREYLARHASGIVAAGMFAMLVATAATGSLMTYAFRELGALATWMNVAIAVLGVLLWLAGILVPLYFKLRSLQRAALRKREQEQSP